MENNKRCPQRAQRERAVRDAGHKQKTADGTRSRELGFGIVFQGLQRRSDTAGAPLLFLMRHLVNNVLLSLYRGSRDG